ncbi:ribosomal-processing cysteine protease Prp [Macrococcoides canis]|uniref:Ribosomal processing cysteine protease Prp n=1 Tax=Macrococcoides canis TaxID=1855823 RepID=A0A4R6C831_9STAP|nr:ribosomal-processing cysteine protease Prp [Macrococcus canis]TDM18487.1 ribosomal-processing cysteine protease Prp [Macrococcus canis]TDM23659.1 ribosomal-processing cysteine protease Prp [Macrococcus canis]TDM31604.1 ribosomal-processing cysteine protease Prp [Macrococcus canis]TDM34961.1 ribosomal-processing cysteine protease Prp [Macrococcus canis]TDM38436.1 ribosomal-processing cysteine protease Prp [Macrococcus canis]
MINVTVLVNEDGIVTEFTMEGHADSAPHGQDLVCAGASAVVFGSMNAVMGLTDERPDIDYADDGGYFTARVVDLNNKEAQLIIQSMLVSLQTIEAEYGQYIKLNYK